MNKKTIKQIVIIILATIIIACCVVWIRQSNQALQILKKDRWINAQHESATLTAAYPHFETWATLNAATPTPY